MVRLHRPASQLRIRLKRVFASYYLDVCSQGIATPSEAYEAMRDYFDARAYELGAELLRSQFEEEVVWLVGEIEQDLRRRHAEVVVGCFERESLEGRFRECLAVAWRRV
ncbi:MAG: hypothetical protein KKA32_17570 [Actinobacteria bacterium]|nr:hypothetical protein [Actinomycetota bacterium]